MDNVVSLKEAIARSNDSSTNFIRWSLRLLSRRHLAEEMLKNLEKHSEVARSVESNFESISLAWFHPVSNREPQTIG